MYIFRNGSIVFWNMPSLERRNFIKFLRNYENQSYDEEVVQEESGNACLRLTLSDKHLEKFTFSNALAMSVKLGIWEASLEKYIENIEYVTEELQNSGVVVLNQSEVLQKLGQLFALRHLINLSSDLLDIPDFYWDHDNLENLYIKMSAHL
ncbi:Required for meiotic nuclear division protein 1-like protein, partial [Armadillidium nasatum]